MGGDRFVDRECRRYPYARFGLRCSGAQAADFWCLVSGRGVKSRVDTAFLKQKEIQVKPRAPAMSKEAMRQESERLVKEAMARKVPITQGKTRMDVKCGKCGAPNRVSAELGQSRVEYACKDCGHRQMTL